MSERGTIDFGFTSVTFEWMARVFLSQSCGIQSAKPITFRHSNENRSILDFPLKQKTACNLESRVNNNNRVFDVPILFQRLICLNFGWPRNRVLLTDKNFGT